MTLYFAICDDNPEELQQIAGVLDSFNKTHRTSVRYRLFTDAEAMLQAALTEHFSHYILDVMMPRMDGITAAQELRSIDPDAKLIFLTATTEFAYQSYRVKAHDYLLKPVQDKQLLPVLEQLQAMEDSAGDCICVERGRSLMRIPMARLSHLEVNQKKLYFHMTDSQICQIAGTMAEFEPQLLARKEFIKIHRSYIVNLNHISMLSPEGCIMFSGKNLPISRLLYHQVRRAYMAHLFGNQEV